MGGTINNAFMNSHGQFEISKATQKHKPFIVDALNAENLPTEDLPKDLSNFLVASQNEKIIGVIGVEKHGDYGLLRSMVVTKLYRKRNIASSLVQAVEQQAAGLGLKWIYLLTETAQDYFAKKGYEIIKREEVPEAIQTTSEFSHICPSSAIIMKKQLKRP